MEYVIVGLVIAAVVGFILHSRGKRKGSGKPSTGGGTGGGKKPPTEAEK